MSIVEETPNYWCFSCVVCVCTFYGFWLSVFTNRPISVMCVCGWVECGHVISSPKMTQTRCLSLQLCFLFIQHYTIDDQMCSTPSKNETFERLTHHLKENSVLCCKFSGNIKSAVILINKSTGTPIRYPLQSTILEVWGYVKNLNQKIKFQ